jgi:hypothetical protein
MAAPKRPSTIRAEFRDNYSAPIVYFDVASAHGVTNGAIQIELASRILVPRADGTLVSEFLTTGRLRCSPIAANHLRNAIVKAVEMLSLQRGATTETTGEINLLQKIISTLRQVETALIPLFWFRFRFDLVKFQHGFAASALASSGCGSVDYLPLLKIARKRTRQTQSSWLEIVNVSAEEVAIPFTDWIDFDGND